MVEDGIARQNGIIKRTVHPFHLLHLLGIREIFQFRHPDHHGHRQEIDGLAVGIFLEVGEQTACCKPKVTVFWDCISCHGKTCCESSVERVRVNRLQT